METFGKALEHLKTGGAAQRLIIKNETVIQEYKGRLYHNVLGVRASYVPTNADLMAVDWVLLNEFSCLPGFRIEDPRTDQGLGNLKQHFKFNVHVNSLAKSDKSTIAKILHSYNGNRYFNPPIDSIAYITYPLGVRIALDTGLHKNVGELLWNISQVYKYIYKNPSEYGIWGHNIEDLFFEGIKVYERGITFQIGS